MKTPTTVTALRDHFVARSAKRAAQARLERELSSYRTPTELADLEAMLQRHGTEDAREIQAALHRLAADRHARSRHMLARSA